MEIAQPKRPKEHSSEEEKAIVIERLKRRWTWIAKVPGQGDEVFPADRQQKPAP